MSQQAKRKPGRPPTGVTKSKPGITIDKRLTARAKKAAFKEGLSFSAYVERAISYYFNKQAAEQ